MVSHFYLVKCQSYKITFVINEKKYIFKSLFKFNYYTLQLDWIFIQNLYNIRFTKIYMIYKKKISEI